MQKEQLSVLNLDGGDLKNEIDAAILAANLELDKQPDNEKAKAEIVVKIEIKPAGEGGHFRAVSTSVELKAPKPVKAVGMYPVQKIDGQRVIVTDPVGEDDGQTSIFDALPPTVNEQPGVAQFPKPQAVNG